MKRIFALVLTLCTVFALASCRISKDPEDLKDKLKEEKYDVTIIDSKSEFDENNVEALLDKFDIDSDGIETIVFAQTKKNSDKPVIVFYCEETKDAKSIEKDLEAFLEDDDLWDDCMDYFNWDFSTKKTEIKRQGKIVAIGHEDTMKIIK